MDSHFNDPHAVIVLGSAAKDLKVVEDGAAVPTVLVGKFDGGGGPQVLFGIHVLERDHQAALPIVGLAEDPPVVSIVSLAIALSKARNFLLSAEGRLDGVRMQVLVGGQVGEA